MPSRLAILIYLPLLFGTPFSAGEANDVPCGCAVVQSALADYKQLSAGMTRAELEKHFYPDGGAQFRDKSTYTRRDCRYIKVEVEFALDPAVTTGGEMSSKDTVKALSKLFIDYPVAD